MNVTSLRQWLIVGVLFGVALAAGGCPGGGGDAKSANAAGKTNFEGTYQSVQEPNMSLQIKPDHKAILTDKDGPKEVTWEQPSDDKLVIHGELAQVELYRNSDGSLRDNMSSDWKKK